MLHFRRVSLTLFLLVMHCCWVKFVVGFSHSFAFLRMQRNIANVADELKRCFSLFWFAIKCLQPTLCLLTIRNRWLCFRQIQCSVFPVFGCFVVFVLGEVLKIFVMVFLSAWGQRECFCFAERMLCNAVPGGFLLCSVLITAPLFDSVSKVTIRRISYAVRMLFFLYKLLKTYIDALQ